MARAANTDYLQGFRFHVSVVDNAQKGFIQPESLQDSQQVTNFDEAGFQSVTVPELSADMVEYREGIFKYSRKFQGVPTVGNVTMQRGIALGDTAFTQWVMTGINGGDYRCDISIKNYARDSQFGDGEQQAEAYRTPNSMGTIYREIKCFNCVPTRVKQMGEMDASGADILLSEVDFEMEYFEISDTGTPSATV